MIVTIMSLLTLLRTISIITLFSISSGEDVAARGPEVPPHALMPTAQFLYERGFWVFIEVHS